MQYMCGLYVAAFKIGLNEFISQGSPLLMEIREATHSDGNLFILSADFSGNKIHYRKLIMEFL